MKETRFKQTEIGLIPEDWEVVTISKIAETSSGGTPSRSIKRYYNGTIRWITTSELKDSRIYDSTEHITEEAVRNSSAKMFPKGTILMAMYGATIGKLGILEVCSTTNQACCAIICHDIKNIYLFYYLFFKRQEIILQGCGAGQPNISQNIVKNINIGLPEEMEQDKIASALTSIDNLLLSLDKLIEKKKLIKQGAMQELLTGKKRLPGFTGEWVEKRLGDAGKIIMGQSPSSEFYNNNKLGLPLIQGNADLMNRKQIIRIYTSYCTKTCDINDIILSVRAPVGSVGKATMKSCIGRGVCCFKNKEEFLFQYLIWLEDKWDKYTTGSTFDSISTNELINIPILIPEDIYERTSIASVLSCMDKEIESLEGKKAKYEQIKQGMMQQLLTGKIRLI